MNRSKLANKFRYERGSKISAYPTLWRELDDPKKHLKESVERFAEQQEKLYADDRYALLLVFQGMDAAGKDSTIKNVTTGVNPAGFETHSFKKPSYKDIDHNFLWRHWAAMPARGRIGLFNRSYYEEVLVVRVHPQIIENRKIPHPKVDAEMWRQRYADFRSMESHLDTNGVKVVKFYLNVSKEEQRDRLLARLERPEKHWKFNPSDLAERAHWEDYQEAFQDAIAATHTNDCPWYVVPADHKPTMRAIVASVIVDTLEQLKLDFPPPAAEDVAEFERCRAELEAQPGRS